MHGPGCPVCVTPLETIDKAIEIAARPEVIFVSYGDMLRRSRSRKVARRCAHRVLAHRGAEDRSGESAEQVVFFGIGFETTAPPNAMAVWQASREGLRNFSMLVSQVLVPPAMRLLLNSRENRVQGFIAPGHVCTVMGYRRYEEPSASRWWWAVSNRWICWRRFSCW